MHAHITRHACLSLFIKGETNQSNIRESVFLANIRTFFPIRIFGQGMYSYLDLLRAVWVQGDQRPLHVRTLSQSVSGSFVEPGAHASARMTHDVHCRA